MVGRIHTHSTAHTHVLTLPTDSLSVGVATPLQPAWWSSSVLASLRPQSGLSGGPGKDLEDMDMEPRGPELLFGSQANVGMTCAPLITVCAWERHALAAWLPSALGCAGVQETRAEEPTRCVAGVAARVHAGCSLRAFPGQHCPDATGKPARGSLVSEPTVDLPGSEAGGLGSRG